MWGNFGKLWETLEIFEKSLVSKEISKVCHKIVKSSYLSQISQIIFVEKKLSCGEILGNFEQFWEILGDFATNYALSCGEKLSTKITFVEKK